MNQKNRNSKKIINDETYENFCGAFTLIELLAVIIILAVIALIATPVVLKVVDNAKESARKSSVAGYADAVRLAVNEKMFENNGSTPTIDEAFLSSLTYQGNTITCNEVKNTNNYGVILKECTVGSDTEDIYCFAKGKTYSCDDTEFIDIYNTVQTEQVAINTFNLTYGGSGSDTANSMIQTSDGGYILIANSDSSDGDITDGNNGNTDILVMKLNSDGSKAWDKTYGGSNAEAGFSMIQTSDGGYILTGYSDSSDGDITDGNNGSDDVLVIKLNSDGTKIWDKTYGGTGSDTGRSIIQTSDGGYILIGTSDSSDGDITDGNNGSIDILVIKLNSDGSKAWDKTYGGSSFDFSGSLIETSDEKFILTGYTNSSDGDITDGNDGTYDILIMKLNNDGSKVWDKTYGGTVADYGNSIIQTSDGGYALTGWTYSNDGDITDGNNGSSDIVTIKLNSDGSKVWDKTYGGTGSDAGRSIIETSDGGYALVGISQSSDGDITDGNNGGVDIAMIKLNSDGTKAWDKTYGGSGSDNVYSIIKTSDGGYIMDGYTTSSDGDITDGNSGGNDILVMKFDSNFSY